MELATTTQLLTEGLAHQAAGRIDAAQAIYHRVLAQQSEHPDALHLLGMVMSGKGQTDEAIALVRRAVAAKPHVAVFHNSLGTLYALLNDTTNAEESFRQAIALAPSYAEAHRNLGLSLRSQARPDAAAESFRAAIQLRDAYGEAWANLAAVLRELGRDSEAADAEWAALRIQGGTCESYLALGLALRGIRRLNDAIAVLREGTRQFPTDVLLHFNLALVLLEAGRYAEGFAAYEWRWQLPEFLARRVDFGRPAWDGSALRGRTLLLHTEQGLGTNVQFVRYAALIAATGARVILHCPPTLAPLFRTVRGIASVILAGKPVPAFDVHAPLASLPHLMKTTLETIPTSVPYLTADPARVSTWRQLIPNVAGRLNVGLVWAGNQKPDPARTCPLAEFAPLAAVTEATFYSLQKGDAASDCVRAPGGLPLTDLSDGLHDFADTAAALSHMHLVISVDTSVAHVAGALGKPVWTLLPYLADWRWGIDRADSPWYPTMRLFRQARQGEWAPVLAAVARALRMLVEAHCRGHVPRPNSPP